MAPGARQSRLSPAWQPCRAQPGFDTCRGVPCQQDHNKYTVQTKEDSFMDETTGRGAEGSSRPQGIGAITLFVEDLEATKRFYREVFGLPVAFEDDDSAVFDFGNTIINLLTTTAAGELIEPAAVASREAGSRHVFTIEVDDIARAKGV
jgi:predicted enzyme related to lactoylglutathione lyase